MPFPVQDQAASTEITAEQKEQEKACLSVVGATIISVFITMNIISMCRAERARKGLFISGWGYSCRKYSAFTGRTEGQKRFIL